MLRCAMSAGTDCEVVAVAPLDSAYVAWQRERWSIPDGILNGEVLDWIYGPTAGPWNHSPKGSQQIRNRIKILKITKSKLEL